jgi:hypothetical protein
MKMRLFIFWKTLIALWNIFSRPAKILVIIFLLLAILVVAFSSDSGFMAFLCLGLFFLSLLSGYVSYRLFSREIK